MNSQNQRIIIVSNRLPIKIKKKNGEYKIENSLGGLATALSPLHHKYKTLWVGCNGEDSESKEINDLLLSKYKCITIDISKKEFDNYYLGFCNQTIWPLFHSFPKITKYSHEEWESYVDINKRFCEKIISITRPGDIIWIHDYHLMLLPEMIREKLPDATIAFFLHIPFPHKDIFRLLPWRKEILNGLLGADLLGFHTYDYTNNFLSSILALKGINSELGKINYENRTLMVDTLPLGIDFEKYFNAADNPEIVRIIKRLRQSIGERKIIFSVDRLDYTKGIPERLEAFSMFLEKNPEWHEKSCFVLAVAPSRIDIPQYELLKKEIDETVGRINGKYSKLDWNPIIYLHSPTSFDTLIALYVIADVSLITPIRDGMNLVAKEYIAANSDGFGVLILSEMAGASKELGESIIVNPNNKVEIAEAILAALNMPQDEQIRKNRAMQKRLKEFDSHWWANKFLERIKEIKNIQERLNSHKLTSENIVRIKKQFDLSKRRLVLLDYDGTLVPFTKISADAVPDKKLMALLSKLASDKCSDVVLISGRDRHTLGKWFGNLGIMLVGEHGAWINKTGKWELSLNLSNSWKKDLLPYLETFVNRIPDSYIEEKDYSLAWHYRNVPDSDKYASELLEILYHVVSTQDINILQGNKVIEIKSSGINKGQTVTRIISEKKYDFILAIGDDNTDESMFKALPESAFTIRVGMVSSHSHFNIESYKEARSLLEKIYK